MLHSIDSVGSPGCQLVRSLCKRFLRCSQEPPAQPKDSHIDFSVSEPCSGALFEAILLQPFPEDPPHLVAACLARAYGPASAALALLARALHAVSDMCQVNWWFEFSFVWQSQSIS